MQKKSIVIEMEKATVEVIYTTIPGKKELEEVCARFLRAVEKEKREKEKTK